ncbi:hypothetical protein CRU87_01625 [Aliarcobacter trophiarum LMG 25534]|uniref:histidine kinase n=1 Tax=Aliarcobacter trophiarum LMG 25534 TaxID=1032241 RepID=A0AAD0QIK7_9BACT|nr:transporter substrate-binding domain-containing protein [Aliarcobacter trophiarum]AXK48111.1 BvgS-like domain-containing signal transduction sensor histidine kinase [Aliarcobacter trophiarum LMG 25534]RXJ93212.1 hypothetical protein CRU87_01625 [Aliarcobacter trophiarum LMG 25534]
MRLFFLILLFFNFVYSSQEIAFSNSSKEYIDKNIFNIAITKNWYPFSFRGDKGEASGISSEYWDLVVQKLGLKTNNIFYDSFYDQLEALKAGKSDIIFSAGDSSTLNRSFATFSKEYLIFPISIATKKDENFIESFNEIKDKKIAVGNNFTSHNILKEHYSNIDFILVDNPKSGLEKVLNDEAFAYIDVKPVLTYNIAKFEFDELKVSGNSGFNYLLKIMVRNEHKELIPLINQAIDSIDKKELDEIVLKWNNVQFQSFIDYKTILFLVVIIFLGTLAFTHRNVTLNILNKKLLKTVEDKTKELQNLNKNLQNMVNAKTNELLEKDAIINQQSKMAAMGEMLENIAHQWRQPLSIISTIVTSMKLKKELGMLQDDEFVRNMDMINKSSQHLSNTIDDFRNFFKVEKESIEFDISKSIEKAIYLLSSRIENHDIKIVQNLSTVYITSYENEFIQVLINILNNSIDILKDKNQNDRYIFLDLYTKDQNVVLKIKDSGGGIDNSLISRIFEPYFTTKYKSQGTGIGLYMSIEIISKHLNGELTVTNQEFSYKNSSFIGAEFTIKIPIR